MLDLSVGNWWIRYENVWAAIYLVPSDTWILEIIFWKYKCNMMRSYMTKFEFLLEPNMISKLGKLPLIYAACIALSLVKLCDPYEIIVMLLKWRSHTYHIYMLLLHWEYTKTCLPFRSTQKYSTSTLGWTQKHSW